MSRKKKEPEERCPKCGCPELLTFARATGFYTSCSACAHVIRPPAAPEPVAVREVRKRPTAAERAERADAAAEIAVRQFVEQVSERLTHRRVQWVPELQHDRVAFFDAMPDRVLAGLDAFAWLRAHGFEPVEGGR